MVRSGKTVGLVSRTRCGILHAAPQSRDRTKHRRSLRPRLCSAPLRKCCALRCVRGTSYPLNVPLRSLNKSSGCGARTLGVCEPGDGTEVSDAPLPHNSCTADETGCARSPAWNSERKTGRPGCCSDAVVIAACDDAATGVTARASGKLDR